MKKFGLIFAFALIALSFLLVPHASALSNPPSGQFTYFYKPPKDGTTVASQVSLNRYIILTHMDESYRDSLKQAGYTGQVLQYLAAQEVDGPGPYANSSASCDSTYQPWRSQVAMYVGDFCKYIHPYESYFLHNSQGQRLYEDYGGGRYTYHMNPAASGWRTFYSQRVVAYLNGSSTQAAFGFDGVFLDNVWIGLWTLTNRMLANSGGAYPVEYSTDAAYRTAMAGFLSQLKSSLNATGKSWPVLGNMAGDDYNATLWDQYLPYVDGGMEEAFGADWNTGYPTVNEWLTDLQKAEKTVAQGKIHLAITQGAQSDTARMRFGYGSYLLAMQPGKSFFRYAKASTGYEYQWSYTDYWTDIGTPNGARYQLADGTWRRNFTRGYVVVNPSTHAVQIVQQTTAPTSTPFVPTIAPSAPSATPTKTSTVVPTATRTATPSSGAITVNFNPVADAYVDSSYPTTNYGALTQIRLDGSPIVRSYLRFSVSGLTTAVTKATLRIYANSSLSTGYTASRVADNTWGETTISYGNAPAIGSAISSSSAVTAATWLSLDVTPYITGNGTFSLVLTSANATALSLASRESTNVPQLIISAGSGTLATATPVSPTATNIPPTLTSVPPTATSAPSTGTTLNFQPVADAYVDSAYPTTNYGSATQIRVDGSPYLNGYLRFTVQNVTTGVAKAVLRIYANSALTTGYAVHAVSNNTWAESTINYGNAPALGSTLGSTSAISANTWTSVDITPYITGNGTFNLALTDPNTTALSLASRESTYAPVLVITTK